MTEISVLVLRAVSAASLELFPEAAHRRDEGLGLKEPLSVRNGRDVLVAQAVGPVELPERPAKVPGEGQHGNAVPGPLGDRPSDLRALSLEHPLGARSGGAPLQEGVFLLLRGVLHDESLVRCTLPPPRGGIPRYPKPVCPFQALGHGLHGVCRREHLAEHVPNLRDVLQLQAVHLGAVYGDVREHDRVLPQNAARADQHVLRGLCHRREGHEDGNDQHDAQDHEDELQDLVGGSKPRAALRRPEAAPAGAPQNVIPRGVGRGVGGALGVDPVEEPGLLPAQGPAGLPQINTQPARHGRA
mmetsp:Transcript_4431/g.15555  ORF Transcript_4431/g.15555 Transcript_4431/m.15555 type:complete len:300 (-) Transcript_4431:526-1425(-)